VSVLLVIFVLGMFEWGAATGLSLPQRRAEAFNTLVFGEIAYARAASVATPSASFPSPSPRRCSSC
jgi:hypothetical protein